MKGQTTRALTVAVAVAVGAVAVAASPARAALPTLGAADGVTATQTGATVEVRLSGAAATAAAAYDGRELTLRCGTHPRPGLLFASGDHDGVTATSATLRREGDGSLTLKTTVNNDRARDACEVARPETARRRTGRIGPFALYANAERPPLARVALTDAGAAWVDEGGRAAAMARALKAAVEVHRDGVLSPSEVAAAGLVALPDEGASPPAGSVGYWTDGHDRFEVVAISAAGRRLVQESLGDGMQRTNVGSITTARLGSGSEVETDTARIDRDAAPTPLTAGPGHVPPTLPATLSGTRLTVRFTGKARATFRRLAGRRVSVACGPASLPSQPSSTRELLAGFQLVAARVPRRGTVLHVHLRAGHAADQCAIADDRVRVATVTPTAAGRAVRHDLTALGLLLEASDGLVDARATAYPAAASLAAAHPKTLVALAGPTAFPARRDRVGVWTDGARQVVLSAVSSTGRRLVFADEGDGVVRTNIDDLPLAGVLLY